ncbi:hypothetical protein SELMODRAFT_405711 [Selaginella moellendorffii]|uniref:Protein kinase domain-containing protein n=1 Tax=Selaginella moellendorffii TaxID=88036 RepID=D8QZG7_SELML|nr:hypothetical protein SELMODRAFT_405711 [Selaginella moellendorffii]
MRLSHWEDLPISLPDWTNVSDEARDLILQLLHLDARRRLPIHDAQATRSPNLTIDIVYQACQEGHWPGDPRVWISPAAPVLECDHLWTSSLDSKENRLENALQLFKLLSSDAMTYATIDALQQRGCKALKLLGVDGSLMQELLQSRLSIKGALCTSRMTW